MVSRTPISLGGQQRRLRTLFGLSLIVGLVERGGARRLGVREELRRAAAPGVAGRVRRVGREVEEERACRAAADRG